MANKLTRELRELLELIFPFLGHHDRLLLLLLLGVAEPELLAFLEQLLSVIWMQSGQYCEEILPLAGSTFWIFVGKVVRHIVHLEARFVEISDGYLVVTGRITMPGILGLQQLLVAAQYLLKPFRVDHVVRRHVVLSSRRCK